MSHKIFLFAQSGLPFRCTLQRTTILDDLAILYGQFMILRSAQSCLVSTYLGIMDLLAIKYANLNDSYGK